MTTAITPRTDPRALGDLAQALIPVAVNLACIVHGDGDRDDIATELAALTPQEKDGLIVVLAALVDPDRSVASALGWVDFDENGSPFEAAVNDRTPLRDMSRSVGLSLVTSTPNVRQFTDEEVLEIRERAVTGLESDAQLAAEFKTSRQVIQKIAVGSRYADVGGPRRPVRSRRDSGTANACQGVEDAEVAVAEAV